ncbi:hypothetical protein LXM94_08025, partial [Rhizobium sp. TRM95111]|nr:hypothetical protein [Rhizobium alarense]
MGNRTKLLATVALPLASLIFEPVAAATLRPAIAVDVAAQVIQVQAEDEATPEELLKKRRQQREEQQKKRQENQKARQQDQQDNQKARQ